MFGSLALPDTYEVDTSMSLWEVVGSGPQVAAELGVELPVGSILQTLRRWPADSGLADLEGNPLYFLNVSARDKWGGAIRGVIVYTEGA